jgi:hypothetical protein
MDFDIFVKVSNGEQNRMKRKIRTPFVVLQRALSVAKLDQEVLFSIKSDCLL